MRWWRFADDSRHHVLAGEPELVQAYLPVMPDLIQAWRSKFTEPPTARHAELLGPAATILT